MIEKCSRSGLVQNKAYLAARAFPVADNALRKSERSRFISSATTILSSPSVILSPRGGMSSGKGTVASTSLAASSGCLIANDDELDRDAGLAVCRGLYGSVSRRSVVVELSDGE